MGLAELQAILQSQQSARRNASTDAESAVSQSDEQTVTAVTKSQQSPQSRSENVPADASKILPFGRCMQSVRSLPQSRICETARLEPLVSKGLGLSPQSPQSVPRPYTCAGAGAHARPDSATGLKETAETAETAIPASMLRCRCDQCDNFARKQIRGWLPRVITWCDAGLQVFAGAGWCAMWRAGSA